MEQAHVNGVDLEYEVRGVGEPVLLIHGSHIGRSFLPLVAQSALTCRYALIRYHRRGFLGSSPVQGPVSIADQAADARLLLEHLGARRAHVVGHSYGGPIALQLAADAPELVQSLVLLEAALLTVPGAQSVVELVRAAGRRYRAGDWEPAQDLFLGSPEERADVARNVPGALEQALRDTDTYFGVEAPAHETWRFGAEQARRITAPTLFVLGARSSQLYVECCEQVEEWVPQTEREVLADATHLLHIQQPAGAATLLADFFGRHPIAPRAPAVSRWLDHGERFNAAVDLLDGHLEGGRAGKPALRTPGGDWSYEQVAAATNRVGNALAGLGVEAENRVLVALPDSPQLVATFLGAIRLGAVPVPVDPTLAPEAYAFLLTDTRAKVAVVDASTALAVRVAREQLDGRYPGHLVVCGDGEPAQGELDFDELTAAADAELSPADTTADDMAFWVYTSGTTGRPTAVVHLQRDMRFCADAYGGPVLGLDERDVTFSVSKLHFAYGLGGGLYLPLAVGATSVLLAAPAQPRMVADVVRRFRPTVVFGVPTGYANTLAAASAGSTRLDFDGVRLCVSAGEPLSGSLLLRWKEQTGLDILDGIGSTETCHVFVSNRRGDVRPDCIGTVVDGYEVRVVDEQGADLPPGRPGALLVRGGSLAPFYWRQPALTRRAMLGEWLRTGDVVVQDESGHLSYRGRQDDMLKVGGMWVSPIEIEAVLAQDERVAECAVVGVPDEDSLVKPEAFVVLDGAVASEGLELTLRQRVRQRLGGNKTPRAFHFVSELPRTPTGNLQRGLLRERALRSPSR
jgi:benzoate-CoA ligase family protein